MSKEQLAYDLLKLSLTPHANGNPVFSGSSFAAAQLMALIVDTDLVSDLAKKHNFNEQRAVELFTALSYLLASDWIKDIIK